MLDDLFGVLIKGFFSLMGTVVRVIFEELLGDALKGLFRYTGKVANAALTCAADAFRGLFRYAGTPRTRRLKAAGWLCLLLSITAFTSMLWLDGLGGFVVGVLSLLAALGCGLLASIAYHRQQADLQTPAESPPAATRPALLSTPAATGSGEESRREERREP